MELELKKETLRCWEPVCHMTLEQEATTETIVPDACPDVWQVLDGEGHLFLQRREAQDGKAECAGLIRTAILYQPEGGEGVRSMEVTTPFSVSPEVPRLTRRCMLNVRARVLSVDVHLLNPRKVLVRVGYSLELAGYAPAALSPASRTEEAERWGIRQKTETCSSLITVAVQEKTFTYTDALVLPSGKPEAEALLRARAECVCTEAKIIGNKLVFKGEAVLQVLCRDGAGKPFGEAFHLPFSQIMDAGEESEDGLCALNLFLSDVKCTLDGEDRRSLQVELEMEAQAVIRREITCTLLRDLYSTAYEVETEETQLSLSRLSGQGEEQESVREVLEAGAEPTDLYDVQVRLGRTGQTWEGKDRILRQEAELTVLYGSGEGAGCLHRTVTVPHRLTGQEAGDCAFTCQLLRMPTAAPAGKGVEVSFDLSFRWMTLEGETVTAISRVTAGERRESGGETPSVILRTVKQGETLWDVAKSCAAGDREILEASGLSSEELYPGQMLLIPKQAG